MKYSLNFIKYVLIFAFLLGSFTGFSQSKKTQFGICLTQEAAMISLNSQNRSNLIQNPSYGASLGFKAERPLSKKLLFETGLSYGYRSYEIENFLAFLVSPISSFAEFHAVKDHLYFHRITIPVSIKYLMTSKWLITIGFDLDLYMNKQRRRMIIGNDASFPDEFRDADKEISTFPVGATFSINRKFFGKTLNTEAYLLFNYTFNELEIPVAEKSNQQVNLGVGFVLWL